ncbi:MAG: prepilin-type N-terminal cleavage/methylation domain-containing protein [Bacilli bacterium]|nr:prepilin-type N-terminal cleavage/methylation domain-containing protein [Bacilli bacterium]
MINNKGFTLIEVLASLVIITFIVIIVVSFSGDTLSINKDRAYRIMKNNIYKVSQDYVKECEAEITTCDLEWNDNKAEFNVYKLKEAGYFKNLRSPIDGKDVGNCMIVKIYKTDNKMIDVEIVDNCY